MAKRVKSGKKPQTPPALAIEIFDRISLLSKPDLIAVIADIGLLSEALCRYEVEQVVFVSADAISHNFAEQMGAAVYDCKDAALKNMKFDVVIGNPPYNPAVEKVGKGNGSGNKIWHKFVELGFELCKENGIVSMVTPNNWRRGNILNGQHKHAQKLMWENSVLYAEDVKKSFPDIGHSIAIDMWAVHKNGNPTVTSCCTMDKLFLRPTNADSTTASILEKFFSACYADDSVHCIEDTRKIRNAEFAGAKHKFVSSSSKLRDGKFFYSEWVPKNYLKRKVIFFDSGSLGASYQTDPIGAPFHFIVEDEGEGAKVTEFLNGKLVQFMLNSFVQLGSIRIPVQLVFRIPKGIMTSNDPLREVFGLTEEEIAHVVG